MEIWSTFKHYMRPPFHYTRSHLHATRHGYPAKKLKIIAVTGTDGKTTTCNMLYHVLKENNIKVGLASTVWFGLPSTGLYRNKTKMTSLPPAQMQKFLKKCVEEKLDYVIVEASSIALHQYRIAGMQPHIACLTNITKEEEMGKLQTNLLCGVMPKFDRTVNNVSSIWAIALSFVFLSLLVTVV